MEGIDDKVSYSFEELIAEIGASFLVNQAGIQWDETDSQAYINGWISFLKEQNAITVISAASKAKKASRYILGGETGEKARYPIGERARCRPMAANINEKLYLRYHE